jgi:uncharacterized protein involved in tellurium resistance
VITDPRFAPKRSDLPWLRRRRLPKSVAAPAAAPAAPAAAPGASAAAPEQAHGAVTDFVTGHSTRHEHHEPAPVAAAPAPPPRPAPATPPAPVSSSLDLDEPVRPTPAAPAPPSASSSLLDLDEPAPAPQRPVAAQPSAAPRRVRSDVRVRAGERVILTVTEPTVTLTRLQSAIGTLTFEAACSAEVGDLRIGCAYELSSGATSTVQLTQGNRTAPPRSRRPILVAAHDRFETVAVDLRQCPDLRRLIVYAFSESRAPLRWGGTLIITTFGGARVELPLESLQSGDSAVVLSLYNVHGEFVLRAEMQTLFGDVRECCRTYGFDRITWLDDRTPVE